MALIIEDGSIVTNANTWVSRADYIAYAASIGTTITDDGTADEQLIKAGEYINYHEENLKGSLVERDQSMSFPRTDLYIEGWYWSSDEIPRQVTQAQMAFALEINAGEDLYNRSANPSLTAKREKIDGAVEVEYAVSDNQTQKLSKSSKADALLASLLKNNGLAVVTLVRN